METARSGEEEVLPRDFGKYRLTRRIATGGMAEIFLAHRHDAPLEPLVIKRILPHLVQTEGFVSMFLDEARIAAGLDHPNVVHIDDIGQLEGSYFLAMEYVHGEDIRCIYNKAYKLQRSLPLSHSIQVIADAARGLAHAHRATNFAGKPLGLVHRDVSPQNILVTYDGHVKVVDFGIAKAAGKVAQTRAGVLKGKYSYMSPEQALGEAIDHRTDLFALGIILYETTTGTRLFKRSNELATLQAIIKCQFVPPSQALPGYPPELERILLRALEKDPEARYQDGDVLADDLEGFLESSRLFAGREAIAEFMADLFADKLAEEEGTGEPAVPDAEAVREELAASRPSASTEPPLEARSAQARLETELATRKRRALAEEGFREDDEGDLEATKAERSGELPRVAVRAHPSRIEPTSAEGPRRVDPEETAPPSSLGDPGAQGGRPDEAATVAAAAAYQPPPPRAANRRVDDSDVAAPPPRRGFAEPTERIRMRESPAEPVPMVASVAPRVGPPPRAAGGKKTLLLAIVLVVLLGVALGALAVVVRGAASGGPAAADTATVTVISEPGAEVFVDGERVGAAGPEGRAGPFDLAPGPRVIRVAQGDLRFERTRSLGLEAGRTYETEIRARRGFLELRVSPWARVTVDGKSVGLTPFRPLSLFEGVHEVHLEHPEAERTLTARVIAGETETLEVRLLEN